MRSFTTPTEAELRKIVEYAERLLGSSLSYFLEDGLLPSRLIYGSANPLGQFRDADAVEWNRSVVVIYRPSERERKEAEAWHDYCAEHGSPIGRLRGADKRPGSKYPPGPDPERAEEGVWVGLTWAAIRRELRGPGSRQLDLLEAPA